MKKNKTIKPKNKKHTQQGTCMMVSIHSRPLRIASTPITTVGQPSPKATQASRVRLAGLQSTTQPIGNATWTCSDSKDIAGSAVNKAFADGTTWQFPNFQKRLPFDLSLTTRIWLISSWNLFVPLPLYTFKIFMTISLHPIFDTGLTPRSPIQAVQATSNLVTPAMLSRVPTAKFPWCGEMPSATLKMYSSRYWLCARECTTWRMKEKPYLLHRLPPTKRLTCSGPHKIWQVMQPTNPFSQQPEARSVFKQPRCITLTFTDKLIESWAPILVHAKLTTNYSL